MMRRLLIAPILILLASACAGTGDGSPKGTVTSAFENIDPTEGVALTFTLQSDPESLQAVFSQDTMGGEGLAAEDAQKILDSSFTLAVKGDEADPAAGTVQILVDVASADQAFELRLIDGDLYLHADARGVAEALGQDPAILDQAAAEAAAGGLDFVEPALNGEWIKIPGVANLLQGMGGAASPTSAENADTFNALARVIEDESTVTSEGSDDAGEHYVVTIPLRQAYERLLGEMTSSLGASGLPPGMIPPASEVPDKDFQLDVWVDGDRVSQIEIDFVKLGAMFEDEAPEGVERFALRIALAEFGGDLSVPEDAIEVDPQELMGAMFGATSSGGSASSPQPAPTAFPCELLETEPENVQAQYAEECPQLQN